jgi:DNA-binding NarL/FixJ family response regulator
MRVMIVARDGLAAEAIRRALRYTPACRVIGWVAASNVATSAVADARPDVALLDDSDGAGTVVALARHIRAAVPAVKIVLLGGRLDSATLAEAATAGVDAAIATTASPGSVGMLIREVVAGNVFHFAPAGAEPAIDAAFETLTARELEILRHVSAGRPNGGIARELWVTEQTVKFHLSNVYRKLGLANRTEAAHYAHLHGLADSAAAGTRRAPVAPVAPVAAVA